MKLQLRDICLLGLGWDDPLPQNLFPTWLQNLEDIQLLKGVHIRRSIVHPEAISPNIELIVSVDASETTAVAAVHARSLLKDGTYDCQLLMGRSKLVPNLTVPRAELKAMVIGSISGFISTKNFGSYVDRVIYVTDSTICLFWLNQDERPLQTGVRNAVIEIRRFTEIQDWFHIDSHNNVADIPTRECSIQEVAEDSDWQKGRPWMTLPADQMPLKTVQDITLSAEEKRQTAVELKSRDILGYHVTPRMTKLQERYSYSKYILDPCQFSWVKVCRVLALVYKFIHKLKVARQVSRADKVVAPDFPTTNNINVSADQSSNSRSVSRIVTP